MKESSPCVKGQGRKGVQIQTFRLACIGSYTYLLIRHLKYLGTFVYLDKMTFRMRVQGLELKGQGHNSRFKVKQ